MPNYTTANLVKAQADLVGAFQNDELRFRDPKLFKTLLANAPIMFPNEAAMRTREDRAVEGNYFLRTPQAFGAARSHNHTGGKGDSGILPLTWTTQALEFVTTLKQADNSIQTFQEQFNNEIRQKIIDFADGYEGLAANFVHNSRTGVNGFTGEGTFDATDDVYQIPAATLEDDSVLITKVMMDAQKYSKALTLACDSISYRKFWKQTNQGDSNNMNLSFQFDMVTFVHIPELNALATGLAGTYEGYWVVIPDGSAACTTWIPKQNREGVETKENKYSTLINPVDGLTYAFHEYEERVDGTSINGYTQDVKTEYQLSLDTAFEIPPLSTVDETPIYAVGLV